MSEPLIELDAVQFAYDAQRPVLRGCDFRLEPGQRVALLGSNGSGKTTLLHIVVGLLKPQQGTVRAFGAERCTESDFYEVRTRAGLLFQNPDDQLFCPTVVEDVAFGPMNLGKSRDEVRQIVSDTLDRLGLTEYQSRITYKLSGGEKRLAALATVLALEPDVLLLDEPTAGLDEEATERLVATLAALPQAMVVVSHDAAFLQRITNRALRLVDGRLLDPGI